MDNGNPVNRAARGAVNIHVATSDVRPDAAVLLSTVFDYPIDSARFAAAQVWIAAVDGELVGSATVEPQAGAWILMSSLSPNVSHDAHNCLRCVPKCAV